MRGKILVYGFAAVVAVLGFASVPAQAHGDRVSVKDSYLPGTILIRTGERRLYYFVGTGEAIRYPVGVGRAGMQWAGSAYIDGKYIRPAWSPPASIRHATATGRSTGSLRIFENQGSGWQESP